MLKISYYLMRFLSDVCVSEVMVLRIYTVNQLNLYVFQLLVVCD